MAKKLPASSLVMHVLLVLVLAVLYGGDLLRYVRATGADVAWMASLPSLGLAFAGVAVLLLAGGLLGFGLATGKDAAWRGYRLGPIAGLMLLFFDFAVLSSMRSPMSGQEQAALAVVALADGASQNASHVAVPDDPRLLASLLEDLGPVPFFEKGERVPRWSVDVRTGCSGPAAEAEGKGPGTLVYCVAGDRKRAWVTLVGVAPGESFGAPRIVSTEEPWMQEVTLAPQEPEPTEGEGGVPSPEDVWRLPTPDEQTDSGR